MEEDKKHGVIEVTEDGVINYAVMNPADVLSGMQLIKPEDIRFLQSRAQDFQERFRTRSMFRSKFEMEFGVLNDDEHPTVDSKYWQAIGEQNVHVSEFINVTYEYKKLRARQKKIEADIDEKRIELIDYRRDVNTPSYIIRKLEAEIEELEVDLDQNIFSQANQQKTAQERMKEIKNWDSIIADLLERGLKYGTDDFEKHHAERYALRYKKRFDNLALADPNAKESIVSHFMSAMKHPDNAELAKQYAEAHPLPAGGDPRKQIELDGRIGGGQDRPVKGSSEAEKFTGLPNPDTNYDTIDEMSKNDPVAATYIARKVRKIMVASPHRAQGETMVTNMFSVQPPAAFSCEKEEPCGLTVAEARNFIVKKALEEGYDYIFFIDDDTLIPRNAMVQLIHHNADIVGGFYYRKYLPLESVGMHLTQEGFPCPIDNYKIGDIIHDTLVLPSGCTLIKTDVFKKIEFPWYKTITRSNRPALTEDTYFCEKARLAGFDIITDTGVQCIHVDRLRGIFYGHPEIVDHQNNVIRPNFRDYFAY